jgi:uncharacterized protein (TIGR03435 family)
MLKTVLMLLACCEALTGQNTQPQGFEVASVKSSGPERRGTIINYPNGAAFNALGVTAQNCLTLAYNVPTFQLAGGPGWMGNERFDIVAKMPAGAVKKPGDPDRLTPIRLALQALLADRFQLVVHRETRTIPAYVLVAAKGGFKLKETADDGHGMFSSNRGKVTARQTSIDTLARLLSGILSSPVQNTTGIKGIFDLTLEWSPDEVQSPVKPGAESDASAEPAVGPSIFTALQEQLGLKLEAQKTPVEMIVIDRIEKPGEN